MTTLFIWLIRFVSLVILFVLTLLLITQETAVGIKRRLAISTKTKADPLASLKKARLPV